MAIISQRDEKEVHARSEGVACERAGDADGGEEGHHVDNLEGYADGLGGEVSDCNGVVGDLVGKVGKGVECAGGVGHDAVGG